MYNLSVETLNGKKYSVQATIAVFDPRKEQIRASKSHLTYIFNLKNFVRIDIIDLDTVNIVGSWTETTGYLCYNPSILINQYQDEIRIIQTERQKIQFLHKILNDFPVINGLFSSSGMGGAGPVWFVPKTVQYADNYPYN